MIVDLSHRLEPKMPSYPGLPEPKFNIFMDHKQPTKQHYAPGVTFQVATYEFGGNTGTYVDAPFHRHPGGADLAGVSLKKLVDLPGLLVAAPEDGPIDASVFKRIRKDRIRGHAVLVRTNWSRYWGGDYFRSGPFLAAEACDLLINGGAALVGIDCANIDDMNDPERPAHTKLLAAGIPIVEHLHGLEQLHNQAFRFFAPPPAIVGGTSFTVRAFAICGDE